MEKTEVIITGTKHHSSQVEGLVSEVPSRMEAHVLGQSSS